MGVPRFELLEPDTYEEASRLISEHGTIPLAGGNRFSPRIPHPPARRRKPISTALLPVRGIPGNSENGPEAVRPLRFTTHHDEGESQWETTTES